MKRFSAAICILAVLSAYALGDTHTAASASYVDVSAAISAATYGDTVSVPSGSGTWASDMTVTKGMSIIGAGIGQTNITVSHAGGYGFLFSPDATTITNQDHFRVSGFTFLSSGTPYAMVGLVVNNATDLMRYIRIDHNKFENAVGYPILISGNFWGVADNNQFAGKLSFGVYGGQEASWTAFYPAIYGTADNFYFEDNTFSGDSSLGINSGHGGRWAFRHNTSTATYMDNPLFDQHGNQDGGIWALMICEIYENTFTGLTTGVNRWEYQRGGKLLMYNNAGGNYQYAPIITVNDDVDSSAPPIQWPYDCYFWNNTWNETRVNAIEVVDVGDHIAENVTFWNQVDSFDGSVGIGVGLLSARPASGLTVGVGYWATDTNTLYRATGSTTWEAYYQPYTYPHPLRDELGDNPRVRMKEGVKIRVGDGAKVVIK